MFPSLAQLDNRPVWRDGQEHVPPLPEVEITSLTEVPLGLRQRLARPEGVRDLSPLGDSPSDRLAAQLTDLTASDGTACRSSAQAVVWLARGQSPRVLLEVSRVLTADTATQALAALDRLLPPSPPAGGSTASAGLIDPESRAGAFALAGMISLLPWVDPPCGEAVVRRVVDRLPDFGSCPEVALPFAQDLYTGRGPHVPLLRGILFEGQTLRRFLDRAAEVDPYRTHEIAAAMSARAFFRAAAWTVSHPYFDRSRARRDPNPYFGIERVCSGFLRAGGDFRGAPAVIAELLVDRQRARPRRNRDFVAMNQLDGVASELWFLAPTIAMLAEVGNGSVRPRAASLAAGLADHFNRSPLPIALARPDAAPVMADWLDEDYRHPGACLAPGLRPHLPPSDRLDRLPTDVVDQTLYLLTRALFGYAWTRIGELEFHSGWPRGLNFSCWDSDLVNRLTVLEEQFPISRVRLRDFDDHWFWQHRRRLWEVVVNGPRVEELVLSRSDRIRRPEDWFRRIRIEPFLGFMNESCASRERPLTIWFAGASIPDSYRTRWRHLEIRAGSPEPWASFGPTAPV